MSPWYRWATLAAAALLVVGVALYAATWPGRAPAAGDLDEQVRYVASRLRCPQCQGLSAWESNSESSLRMREEIRAMLEAGMTPDEIIRHYVERYGTWELMSPPLAGFSALAYVVPAAGLLLGAWGLRRYLRAGSGARAVRPAAGATDPADLDPLVSEALERFRDPDRA